MGFILILYSLVVIHYRAGKPSAGLHLDVTKNGNVVEVNNFYIVDLTYFLYTFNE